MEEGERVTLWKCRFTVVSGSHASTRALFFPHSFSLCPLKNTWCKLTLAGGGSKGRKGRGKKGKDIGQRENRSQEEYISGIAVRSLECLHFAPCSLLPHAALKTTATSPQAVVSSSAAGSSAAISHIASDILYMCYSLTHRKLYLSSISEYLLI